jgi:hypothetical protein
MQGSFMAISQAARLHFGRATEEVQQMRMRIKGIMEGSAEEYKGIWTRNTAAVTKAANDQTRIFVQASKEMEREAKERNERIIKNEMEMLKKKAEQDNAHFTEFKEKMDGIYEGMVSGYGDAIGSMIVDGKDFGKSMEEVFKNMAREFISQVTQMMIKWAAFQALTGGAGGFGGGIFGFAKGVDTVVNKPTMFMAGEGGPERVTVQPMAGSNNGGGGGGGSPTNVNIGDIIVKVQLENIDSANVQRLMEAMAREIRAKAGPAVRFSLAAKTLADQNPGRTF